MSDITSSRGCMEFPTLMGTYIGCVVKGCGFVIMVPSLCDWESTHTHTHTHTNKKVYL